MQYTLNHQLKFRFSHITSIEFIQKYLKLGMCQKKIISIIELNYEGVR